MSQSEKIGTITEPVWESEIIGSEIVDGEEIHEIRHSAWWHGYLLSAYERHFTCSYSQGYRIALRKCPLHVDWYVDGGDPRFSPRIAEGTEPTANSAMLKAMRAAMNAACLEM